MSRMLYKLGGWVARHRIKVICAWIVVLVASIGLAITLKPSFSEDMSIPDTPSEKALDVIHKEFPHGPDKGSIRVILLYLVLGLGFGFTFGDTLLMTIVLGVV
ncbi:hypothetical protein MOB89_13585, partial [Bacillus inaquosorum]|nr:hypothetical protein [Bacillus inaquosorum]